MANRLDVAGELFKGHGMNFKFGTTQWGIIIAFLATGATLAYCTPPGTFRMIDFEMTGTVWDHDSKQPIEGAYVMAIYEEAGCALGVGCKSWCVKTKGMYTGKDGTFHFPVEKLDSFSPSQVTAIKPGYFREHFVIHPSKVQRAQGKENYTGRDVILAKQDPGKPDFQFGGLPLGICTRAEFKDQAEANIEYLKIEQAEYLKYGDKRQASDSTLNMIRRMESLPDRATSPSK